MRRAVTEPWSHYLRRLRFIPDEIKKEWRPRLPDHYLRHLAECENRKPEDVHLEKFKEKYYYDEFGTLKRSSHLNTPIRVTFPRQADEGLWGGVGYIQGFVYKQPYKRVKLYCCRLWKPYLKTRVFYSEILNRWMAITVSLRTLELVDRCYGFDRYILETHVIDLKSLFGSALKREMLVRLAELSEKMESGETASSDDLSNLKLPNKVNLTRPPIGKPANIKDFDQAKHQGPSSSDVNKSDLLTPMQLLEKYSEFVMPREEAEWIGLTLEQAIIKQIEIEERSFRANDLPLKFQLMYEALADPTEVSNVVE